MNTIFVTGASGYLASWVVKELLQRGHRVHGTVRNLGNADKIKHLKALSNQYPGQLQLFAADLLAQGSFDAAMAGCSVVVHVASPYSLEKPKDPERELLAPAIEGTREILAAVNRNPCVRRVVLTSSIMAMFDNARELCASPGGVLTEQDENRSSTLTSNPYALSKTKAEQVARQLQREQDRWDLITIHPGAIFGPSLSARADATSVTLLKQFVDGSFRSGVPELSLGVVDVRDVAFAHAQACDLATAHGRYIVVAQSLRLLDIAALLRRASPGHSANLPRKQVAKALVWLIAPFIGMTRDYVALNVGYPSRFDASRSQTELKVSYRAPLATLGDHVQQLTADGLVST